MSDANDLDTVANNQISKSDFELMKLELQLMKKNILKTVGSIYP